MTKIQHQIFLSLIFGMLAWNTTTASLTAAEALIFKEVDETFWVIRSREAFNEGAKTLLTMKETGKGDPLYLNI